MKSPARTRHPFWRRTRFWFCALCVLGVSIGLHRAWQPGLEVRDGRDDLGRNALWIGHGWLGDDAWFGGDSAKKARFRAPENIRKLAQLCRRNGIRDLYPHLTPTQLDGAMIGADDAQIERFLDNTKGLRVLPWTGGRLGSHVVPGDETKTARFVASVSDLMEKHPRLAGVHLNVEPWKSGDMPMLRLLESLRAALPKGKILSVAAYAPSAPWSPFKITWKADYLREVAARCDQMVFMFYDSSIHDAKLYQWYCARWTLAVLQWTQNQKTEILFGVPTYGHAGPKLGPIYHNPRVETLSNALRGVHRGLSDAGKSPSSYAGAYAGAAIYCEWETDDAEWKVWRDEFAAQRR